LWISKCHELSSLDVNNYSIKNDAFTVRKHSDNASLASRCLLAGWG
jgi:hypothetical protein